MRQKKVKYLFKHKRKVDGKPPRLAHIEKQQAYYLMSLSL